MFQGPMLKTVWKSVFGELAGRTARSLTATIVPRYELSKDVVQKLGNLIPERAHRKVILEKGIDGYMPVAMGRGAKLNYPRSIMIEMPGLHCRSERNPRSPGEGRAMIQATPNYPFSPEIRSGIRPDPTVALFGLGKDDF